MATYPEIQGWVKAEYGFVPKTCWIAHCKELAGLSVARTPNRLGKSREDPCPEAKRPAVMHAFRHFKMT